MCQRTRVYVLQHKGSVQFKLGEHCILTGNKFVLVFLLLRLLASRPMQVMILVFLLLRLLAFLYLRPPHDQFVRAASFIHTSEPRHSPG